MIGIIASLIMFGGGVFWLNARAKKANASGEGYGNHPNEQVKQFDTANLPSFVAAIIPILVVLVLNFVLSTWVFAEGTTAYDYLKNAPFSTSLGAVRGTWALVIALIVGVILVVALNFKRFGRVVDSLNAGTLGSMLPILNTASEVGYGNVVKTLSAFAIVQAALLGISDNPLITSAIATNVLAGITGSASGGMSIALGAMGQTFYDQAVAMGINPQVLHRVVAIACGGLDSLPHNGAVVTLLGITQLNHKQSYADVGMVSVVIPVITCIVAIVLGSIGIV